MFKSEFICTRPYALCNFSQLKTEHVVGHLRLVLRHEVAEVQRAVHNKERRECHCSYCQVWSELNANGHEATHGNWDRSHVEKECPEEIPPDSSQSCLGELQERHEITEVR